MPRPATRSRDQQRADRTLALAETRAEILGAGGVHTRTLQAPPTDATCARLELYDVRGRTLGLYRPRGGNGADGWQVWGPAADLPADVEAEQLTKAADAYLHAPGVLDVPTWEDVQDRAEAGYDVLGPILSESTWDDETVIRRLLAYVASVGRLDECARFLDAVRRREDAEEEGGEDA